MNISRRERNRLLRDLQFGEKDAIRNAAIKLGKNSVFEAIPILLSLLSKSRDIATLNSIAISLTYLKPQEAVPILFRKIFNKTNLNYSGTLIYSLQFFDCRSYLIELVRIICSRNYEAREMAIAAISEFKGGLDAIKVKEALSILNQKLTIRKMDFDQKQAIRRTLKILKSM